MHFLVIFLPTVVVGLVLVTEMAGLWPWHE